jgi:hypothetical protein
MSMSISWPPGTGLAIAALFDGMNELDVFVEDYGMEPFYLTLIRRIAPRLRLLRVIALGGCEAVKDAARIHDFERRPALFLIDGDFAWVRGESMPSIDGLFRLRAYCIENLLVCEVPFVRIVMEQLQIHEEEAVARVEWHSWIESLSPLVKLFRSWAVLNYFRREVPTVDRGHGCVVDGGSVPVLSDEKVRFIIREVDEELRGIDSQAISDLNDRIDDVLRRVESEIDVVSGKDFLIPFILFRLKALSLGNRRILQDELVFRLANNACSRRFRHVVGALYRAKCGRNNHWEVYSG